MVQEYISISPIVKFVKNFYTLFFASLLILICIITGYYYTVFEPEKNVLPEKSQAVEDPVLKLNQRLVDLEIIKNFWKNKIELANQDQYNIFIDLSDSLISLEMSGITAHSAKILNFEIAQNLKSLKQSKDIIKMLREPFHLLDEWASIPKNPIRIKDISGFQWDPDSLNFVPTQTDTEFVFIILKCSRNLSVMISQRAIIGDMPSYINSDQLTSFESITNNKSISDEVPFSQLLQKNWIGIEIPRSDAISLFRALVDNSLVVLCI
jgi:hypothetical protein